MPIHRNEQGQMIRKDGSVVEAAGKGRSARKPAADGDRICISHLKVDRILGGPGPLREEYEKLLENPNTLLKDLAAWFADRGHTVNLTAINRHRHRHRRAYDQVRTASQMAAGFCKIIQSSDPAAGSTSFVDAAQGRLEMHLMHKMFDMQEAGTITPEQWQKWTRALNTAVTTRRSVEEMRIDRDRRAQEAAAAIEKMDPKASSQMVVEKVREILGV